MSGDYKAKDKGDSALKCLLAGKLAPHSGCGLAILKCPCVDTRVGQISNTVYMERATSPKKLVTDEESRGRAGMSLEWLVLNSKCQYELLVL